MNDTDIDVTGRHMGCGLLAAVALSLPIWGAFAGLVWLLCY